MSKLKITEVKCFDEVAKVIGAKNAERELFIASQSKNADLEDSKSIVGAFYWDRVRQGYDFWDSVWQGINPYEQ